MNINELLSQNESLNVFLIRNKKILAKEKLKFIIEFMNGKNTEKIIKK